MSSEACERIKREVIAESNRIRTNPKAYIPILEEYLKNFDGNLLTLPEKKEILETEEGPRAYKEAIEFLKNQKPISIIEYDEEASKVAQDYSKFLSNSKGEQVEDESQIQHRVEKYLEYDYSISENIDFGGSSGIEEWKGIIYTIYEKEEAEEIEKKIENFINKENEKTIKVIK